MTDVIREDALRASVDVDRETLAAVEDGFVRLARGEVRIPPIMGLEMPEKNGAADVKAAYVQGWDGFAIKISTRFFDNPKRDLPSGSGLMTLLDADTGRPQAVLLDNGYLTTVRTALAGALAAKYLAPETISTVAVFGAGSQAQWQLKALRLVRDFERVRIVARDPERGRACAAAIERDLGVNAEVADSANAALAAAQVAITTTPATTPILHADGLHAGLHITAMGSDAAHKNEIDPAVWPHCDVAACDVIAQCESRGELRHAQAAGTLADTTTVRELGAIAAGRAAGRTEAEQITLCDLTGVGVQDTAIARLAWQRARSA